VAPVPPFRRRVALQDQGRGEARCVSQQINLFNVAFLPRKRHFSAIAMAQGLLVVIVGALAIYGYEVRQNRLLAVVAADTDKQIAARREELTRFTKEFSQQGASRTLAEDLARAEARLQARLALLADVQTGVGGDAHGYSRYLAALARQTVPGVWLTGLGVGGKSNELVIRGRALESASVPAYIGALNREAPLAGRPVGELRLQAKEAPPPPAKTTDAPKEPTRFIEFSVAIPLGGTS
jgi:Tfp pilus assembly protein PilN